MLSILADVFKTATRQEKWDAPDSWHDKPRINNSREAELIRRQRVLAAMRDAGRW